MHELADEGTTTAIKLATVDALMACCLLMGLELSPTTALSTIYLEFPLARQ